MGLKWEDIGIDFQFEMPTEEEVNKVLETYEAHQSRISEVRRIYGVDEDKAHQMAMEIESGEVFYIPIGGNYEPGSIFYASRYKIVKKLEKKLSDEEVLYYAKSGLLSLRAEMVKQKHRFMYSRYMKINSLVREAYYAYYREVGFERLEKEQQDLIKHYKILSGSFGNRIAMSGIVVNNISEQAILFVQSLIEKYRTNKGIEIEGGRYGILSFENRYFCTAASKLDNSEQSIHILVYMKQLLDEHIKKLENMNIEEYRLYRFTSMHLNDNERQIYDHNIREYQKSF